MTAPATHAILDTITRFRLVAGRNPTVADGDLWTSLDAILKQDGGSLAFLVSSTYGPIAEIGWTWRQIAIVRPTADVLDGDGNPVAGCVNLEYHHVGTDHMLSRGQGWTLTIGSDKYPGVYPGDRMIWGKLQLKAVSPSYPASGSLPSSSEPRTWAIDCEHAGANS